MPQSDDKNLNESVKSGSFEHGHGENECLINGYLNEREDRLEDARLAYSNLFGEIKIEYKSDEEYIDLLKKFEKCANEGMETSSFTLLKELISGTERQLAKLGYVLAKGKYSVGGIYKKFDYPRRKSGEPYAPVYLYSRFNWSSTLKVNLDCFDEQSPKLGYSADIRNCPEPVKWLEECARITYKSGEFGWLDETKNCFVMKVNKELPYDMEALKEFFDDEYIAKLHEGNDAIFTEDGEKEYSVEICHITNDGEIVILCRYTIDGWDQGDRPSKAEIIL